MLEFMEKLKSGINFIPIFPIGIKTPTRGSYDM